MSDRTSSQQRPVEELSQYLTEVTGEPVDEPLLTRALTHRSYSYEHGGLPHNERLEFLGDSVLGLVVTDHLHESHPDLSEGELAKLRAAVVNMRALADVARAIDLGDYILLGRGETTTGGRDKNSILADTVEAVIGAVYLSTPKPGGLDAAGLLVHSLLGPLMKRSATLGAGLDWKTSLQEVAAGQGLGGVLYRTSDEARTTTRPSPQRRSSATRSAVTGPAGRRRSRSSRPRPTLRHPGRARADEPRLT